MRNRIEVCEAVQKIKREIERVSKMWNFSVISGVFFFSSRRRHTRSYGDWSSDRVLFRSPLPLIIPPIIPPGGGGGGVTIIPLPPPSTVTFSAATYYVKEGTGAITITVNRTSSLDFGKIGRASCRERV